MNILLTCNRRDVPVTANNVAEGGWHAPTVGPAIMMIIVPQLGCNHVSIIAVLTVAMLLNGAYYGGSFMNHLELSANYAGSTSAFASTISSIISFCAPLLANLITDENTLTAWNTVFYTSAILTSLPVVIYLIFGSTEEQYWNKLNFDISEPLLRRQNWKRMGSNPGLRDLKPVRLITISQRLSSIN
uniref:Uncharacterized protein n=1 Tax=Timema cristinae TaxID=61476 RepID=A0A7R9GTV6_TIMCR|nr:unnamed protein product [Timema cristinae]